MAGYYVAAFILTRFYADCPPAIIGREPFIVRRTEKKRPRISYARPVINNIAVGVNCP